MYARSRLACGDWDSLRATLQVTHMAWRSMTGSEVRGVTLAAAWEVGAAIATASRQRGGGEHREQRPRPRRAHELSASASARLTKPCSIWPREMATIRPWRSMMKLSGT